VAVQNGHVLLIQISSQPSKPFFPCPASPAILDCLRANQGFMSKFLIGFDSARNRRAVDIILKPTILE
jgi:hypothetical protein